MSEARALPLSVVLTLQALLLASSLSPRDDLLERPIRVVDYTSHFYSATHLGEHFANTGSFWGYDPFWMAGYPEGFVGLVDNKLFAVLVSIAPHGFEAAVFNSSILLAIACVPWLLHAAARGAGATRAEANAAALAGVVLTFGSPITTFFWIAGAVSFLLASALAVPAAIGVVRAMTDSSLISRGGAAAAALAMLAVFVHPLASIPLASAAAVVMIRRPRRARAVAELALLAALLVLPLLPVLEGFLANRAQVKVIDPRAAFLAGGIGQLVRDWWTHLFQMEPSSLHGVGGLGAVLVAALVGFARSCAPADASESATRRATIATMAVAAALAYLGVSVDERLGALQPHRFLIVLGFFAALPAGRGLAFITAGLRSRRPGAWLVAIFLTVFAAHSVWMLGPVRVLGSGIDPAEAALSSVLEEVAPDDGRVLVESVFHKIPVAAGSRREVLVIRFALLPLAIEREFLGNVRPGPFTAQRYAGFDEERLLGRYLSRLDAEELGDLFARYAVSAVIACSPRALDLLERSSSIVEARADLGDCRAFRVREPNPSRLLAGEGRVRAAFDRIEVRDARGQELVLKYHWIPTLVTEPPLPIEEAPQPGAPVGFISVRPGGIRDFDVRSRTIGELLYDALLGGFDR